MRPRTALIAVVALALAAPSPAMAAAKKKKPAPLPKVCNLLTDVSGDGEENGVITSNALDLISADIATGKNELVAVLRLGSTDTKSDHWAKLGYEWNFGATANGARYLFKAKRTSSLQTEIDSSTVNIGSVTGVKHTFKVVGNTFEWRVKRSDVGAQLARPGLYWSLFSAESKVFGGNADTTDPTPKRYIDRQPSCVLAG